MKEAKYIVIALAVFPIVCFSASSDKARIVTHKSIGAECLAAVNVTQIDGHSRQLPAIGFDLEPGRHTMNGQPEGSSGMCPRNRESRYKSSAHTPPLEGYFEAGNVYYVGYDHGSSNAEDWRIIIWKVESEDGEVIFDLFEESTEQPD